MRPANPSPSSSLPAQSGGHLPLALLRQYVAGTLTPASQHEVEAHTLACPYCAEILEGLSVTDLATTDKALSQLQLRLRSRLEQEEPRQAPIAWQRLSTIAAAVLLFVLVGTVGWLGRQKFKTRHSTREVATVTVRPSAQPADAPLATPEVAPTLEAPSPPPPAAPEVAMAPSSAAASRSYSARRSAKPATSGEAALMKASRLQTVADSISTEPKDMVAQASAPNSVGIPDSVAAPLTGTVAGVAVSKAPRSPAARFGQITTSVRRTTQFVTGRITDQQGQALPGVTVTVKDTKLGTSTGPDGTFSLVVPKDKKSLTISSIGYETQEKKLANDTTLTLALAADTRALNEVVTIGYGSKRKSKMPTPPPVAAMPVGGFPAFDEYLKKNLKYPEEAESKHLEGTVRLEFTVTPEGKIENLKVTDGLSEECDAEAKRLVQEGPAWRPAIIKGRPAAQKVKVNVPFTVK
ncbi:TonB family protein [Hymenobacter crusticola]|uniref:TonB C-terminal domain-containing protein n=1 Tax=Hymenobacter crusticola TaxID=1770526 RepID=A0A243WJZ3_9BACT|nr:TonB family protein [Hymenobacter crusticola]OUJ76218.1 hypothetical protein BXP70_02845 [Hymenobacter crusticola]